MHADLAKKYPDYLTSASITKTLKEDDVSKLKIVLVWLKEGLQVLSFREPDYVLNFSPAYFFYFIFFFH